MKDLRHASPLAALKCRGRPGDAAAERSSSRILVRAITASLSQGRDTKRSLTARIRCANELWARAIGTRVASEACHQPATPCQPIASDKTLSEWIVLPPCAIVCDFDLDNH